MSFHFARLAARHMSLSISHLSVSIRGKIILSDVSLDIKPGKVHALMGPNGSGKSTLAAALMGAPEYETNKETWDLSLDGVSIKDKKVDERARSGLFLAFQTPVAVPGVNVANLLRTAYQSIHGKNPKEKQTKYNTALSFSEFNQKLLDKAKSLSIPQEFLRRGLNEEFSGGEKKKLEMLQAVVLTPKYAIFDEIDTGLDVDALKIVATGITTLKDNGTGILIITHYQRILRYIKPDFVHILVDGRIVASGNDQLAEEIEREGYGKWTK